MERRIDFPIEDCAKKAKELVAAGHTVHQKFTCAGCGARQTMGIPNKFFTTGTCQECGHVTDIEKSGCNYVLLARIEKPKGNSVTKLSDQTLADLSDTATKRTKRVLADILQLVDDPAQAMSVAGSVAAVAFAFAARAAQIGYKRDAGAEATFDQCLHAVVGQVMTEIQKIARDVELPPNVKRAEDKPPGVVV